MYVPGLFESASLFWCEFYECVVYEYQTYEIYKLMMVIFSVSFISQLIRTADKIHNLRLIHDRVQYYNILKCF